MKDEALARKIETVKGSIDDAKDLSPDEREALHDLVDHAAATANGSQQKLDDLTVSHCKAVLRTARFELSFKDRVVDAIGGPLTGLKDEIIKGVGDMLKAHVVSCPNQYVKPQPTTILDVIMAMAKNTWFYFAVAAIAFNPNAVAIIDRLMK